MKSNFQSNGCYGMSVPLRFKLLRRTIWLILNYIIVSIPFDVKYTAVKSVAELKDNVLKSGTQHWTDFWKRMELSLLRI